MIPQLIVVNVPNALVAVTLAVLAVVVWRAKPRDTANRLLATYLAVVAANYALVLASNLTQPFGHPSIEQRPPLSHAFLVLAYVFLVVDPVLLVFFAGVYPRRNVLASRGVRGAVLAAAAGVALIVATRTVAAVNVYTTEHFLVEVYVSTVYVLTAAAFLVHAAREPRTDATAPLAPRPFIVGWLVVVFFRLGPALTPGYHFERFVTTPMQRYLVENALDLGVGVVTLLAVTLAVQPLVPRDRRAYAWRLTGSAAVACVGLGAFASSGSLLVIVFNDGVIPPADTLLYYVWAGLMSVWFPVRWLFFGAVAIPALLRNQVMDIDTRLRRGLVAGVVAGVLIVLFVVSSLVIEAALTVDGALPAKAVAFLVIAALGATQAVHVGRLVAHRVLPPEHERLDAYRHARRLDVYREAAAAVADGRAPPEDLERLRVRLGLTREDARLASASVRATPAGVLLQSGETLRGRYRVERLVGRGGHGRVFLARDLQHGVDVAVKEVRPGERGSGAAARIEQEVLVAGRLQAARVVPVRDYFVDGARAVIVTPFMPGGSLADRLRERGPLPPALAARALGDVLSALEAAHAAGIVHRDVKPANVLFDAQDHAYLGDFGIALLSSGDATATSFVDPRVPGTLAYLPPEAFDGASPSPAWDVHAAGTLLHEALTGRLPGDAAHAVDVRVPPALEAVIERARAPDPRARYPNAAAMRAAVEAAAAKGVGPA